MEFDRFTVVLLLLRDDAPKLDGPALDAIQNAHLAHLAKLHEAGHLARRRSHPGGAGPQASRILFLQGRSGQGPSVGGRGPRGPGRSVLLRDSHLDGPARRDAFHAHPIPPFGGRGSERLTAQVTRWSPVPGSAKY